jgi:hypothetical protein
MLSEPKAYKQKEEIKRRIDRNQENSKRQDSILLFTNLILIALSNSSFQELNMLTLH